MARERDRLDPHGETHIHTHLSMRSGWWELQYYIQETTSMQQVTNTQRTPLGAIGPQAQDLRQQVHLMQSVL
jgi:hypothetical protein